MSRRAGAPSLVILTLIAVLATAAPSRAGGLLEGIDFTTAPSPIPGHVIVRTVPSRWDDRCLPVLWRVNDSRDPIPNPLGEPVVSLAEATGALERALAVWNAIPTSYIDMRLTGTVSNPEPVGFDLINEVTFIFGAEVGAGIGLTRLTRLVEDTVLEDGDDLNGDGIPDVSAAIQTCEQVDGRTRFPAGSYKAGTILEADVILGAELFAFGVQDADLVKRLFDVQGVATHEFGHALGLSHSLHSQRSEWDGRGAVMGTVGFFDPVDKLALRTLDSDDIAWASYHYQAEAFAERYGLITGTVQHGRRELPVLGGAVFAVDRESRELTASGHSGTVQFSGDPATGNLFFLPPETGIVDGRYVIPVPAGKYSLSVKPANLPLAPLLINLTPNAGDFYGLLDFHEEGIKNRDGSVELHPERGNPFHVRAGRTLDGVDVVTNRTIDVNDLGPFQVLFSAALEDPAGNIPLPYVAVRVSANRFAEVTRATAAPILAGLFLTAPSDPSVVLRFPQAMLTTGTVNPDGTASLNLAHPLARVRDLVGRDVDLAPAFFDGASGLGHRVKRGIARGEIENLFLVLNLPPPPYPGPNAQPPLLGFTCHFGVAETLSYYTVDGETFFPFSFCDVSFSLIVGEPR